MTETKYADLVTRIAIEIENHFHTVGCGICGNAGTMFCERCTNKTSVQSMYSCSREYALMVAGDIVDVICDD